MQIKERISKLLEALNKGVYERELELRLALLSSIAGESIFLLGPPGVAKSLVARKLKFAYKDASVFEYLMSRFSTPDEIFGPVSIKKLKNDDEYERVVEKYLPTADVVFLDEIWKAGPSIQNALLTVVNEKIFRNGNKEIKVPMKALLSASNELPAKGQGLEALWDRFLVRLVVEGIGEEENFNKMISEKLNAYEDSVDSACKISNDEYKEWDKKIDDVVVPENVFKVIRAIRSYIADHNTKDGNEDNVENQIYVSDRRWRKIVRLMRASAFLNDRNNVDLMDCFLITHCIWNEEEQRQTVDDLVREAIEKYGYTVNLDFKGIREELDEFKVEIKEETKFVKDTRAQVLKNVHGDYYEILNSPNGRYDSLIKKSDFENLDNNNKRLCLYCWESNWNRVRSNNSYDIRKGDSKFTIFIDGSKYSLQQTTQGERRESTRKPHSVVEEKWDERVDNYLQHTQRMRDEIKKYSDKELKHLRINIFVNPMLANIVESHIDSTKKEIEKIELEIKEIQNGYKTLKDNKKTAERYELADDERDYYTADKDYGGL